jgi:biopolymer transport protein ExbB
MHLSPFLMLAQVTQEHSGWLTTKLLSTFTANAEWVLWLLAFLSVGSVAVMLERGIYFATHRLKDPEAVILSLVAGDYAAVKTAVANNPGLEAAVLREGLNWMERGPDSVEEVINATMARERPRYERFLSLLGTVGSNAPFIGLFGTVLGIIKAFHDLGSVASKGVEVQQTVMAGISEALVATAVGLAVAIPAVIGYNLLVRQLKSVTSSAVSLGHALVGHLRATTGK